MYLASADGIAHQVAELAGPVWVAGDDKPGDRSVALPVGDELHVGLGLGRAEADAVVAIAELERERDALEVADLGWDVRLHLAEGRVDGDVERAEVRRGGERGVNRRQPLR